MRARLLSDITADLAQEAGDLLLALTFPGAASAMDIYLCIYSHRRFSRHRVPLLSIFFRFFFVTFQLSWSCGNLLECLK